MPDRSTLLSLPRHHGLTAFSLGRALVRELVDRREAERAKAMDEFDAECEAEDKKERRRKHRESEQWKAEAEERMSTCPNCAADLEEFLGAADTYSDGRVRHTYTCGAIIDYTASGEFFQRIAPCGKQPKRPDLMSATASLNLGAPSIG